MKKFIRIITTVILLALGFSQWVYAVDSPRDEVLKEAEVLNPDVATSLNNLAMLYMDTGRYSEAEPLFKRALEIREKALGKDHPDVAHSLNDLALLYMNTGRYSEAEPLFKRALEIWEKAGDHPNVARSLNNLAALYMDTGRYSEAEPLFKRALEIREKALRKDHPDVAMSLNNLAMLYKNTGRYSEAEPLFKRALEILEKAGKDHPNVATSLNNMAALYMDTGRYSEAEPLFKRALDIWKKALGKDHPNVATSLDNLALLYMDIGRYSEAEPLFKRALEIREKALGKDHPNVATSLNNLAYLYMNTGRYSEAEPLFKRALDIWEKALGKDHPNVATSLDNLAFLYATTGDQRESHRLFVRGIGINDRVREGIFLLLSEKQKINYMEQTKGYIMGFLTHSAYYMKEDGLALTDTLNEWLRWKGAVMEAQGRYIDALYQSDNPEIKKKFDELTGIRREKAKLQLSKPEGITSDEYRERIRALEERKEALEAELSRLSKDFALEKTAGRADVKRISGILPKGSVYIDFAKIKVYDFKENKFGKYRYLAFVLLPDEKPIVKLIDISDAETVDKHIKAYHDAIEEAIVFKMPPRKSALDIEAKVIYEAVIKPIEGYIKDKKELYISPDGNLDLIPFDVLVTPKGRYLTEDYPINYVTAGRDIVRFTDTSVARGEAIIMVDPDYDMGLKEKIEVVKAMGLSETYVRGAVSRDAGGLRFNRLSETQKEGDKIESVLKDKMKLKVSPIYQDKKAIEEILYTAKSPMILHLATHGYFLSDEKIKQQQKVSFGFQGIDKLQDTGIENPMLRSGIVLAGVNASLKEGRDDGMVSAEKILGLKLKGTDLVVLSACETGVGEVKNGEGVFGLKRSFILSGAKTVVMSLWSVPNEETTEMMTDFYSFMAEGKTKEEALRQARLKMMKKKPNPFFWGAFVMVGKPE